MRKKVVRTLLTLSLITSVSMLGNLSKSYASSSIEHELNSVIQMYDENQVQVQEGMALKVGETLDLSEYPNWELSNTEVASIENGLLSAVQEGTVFLSQQIDEKAYIIELYVFNEEVHNETIMMSEPLNEKKVQKVFIDPGHGGTDPGNVNGSTNGITESVINLNVSNMVKDKLEAKGIEVMMSRTQDKYISLEERANMANRYGADLYVSIHQNSAGDITTANGIETFYHRDKVHHKPLSDSIQSSLIKETGARSRGVKSANFAVLRLSNMPSALVEGGFMTNPAEYAKLKDPAYQNKLATGISNAVVNYLATNVVNPPDGDIIATGTVIDTDSLNVRAGYGTGYPIIGTLKRNEPVNIYETKNNWHKIHYRGTTGYVSGSYIKVQPIPTPPPQPSDEFIDIANHWAKEQILDFKSKGYIDGYSDKTFRPDGTITRAEFVKITNKVFGLTTIDESRRPNFIDVSQSDWYYNELSIAMSAGYIEGYSDNTFKPNGYITREEASKIVASIAELKGDGNLTFADSNQIGEWARGYVDSVSDNRIMNGYSDNTFRPKNNITRAETVVTLDRMK